MVLGLGYEVSVNKTKSLLSLKLTFWRKKVDKTRKYSILPVEKIKKIRDRN